MSEATRAGQEQKCNVLCLARGLHNRNNMQARNRLALRFPDSRWQQVITLAAFSLGLGSGCDPDVDDADRGLEGSEMALASSGAVEPFEEEADTEEEAETEDGAGDTWEPTDPAMVDGLDAQVSSIPTRRGNILAAGDLDGDQVPELYTAFHSPSGVAIYRGTATNPTSQVIYPTNPNFKVTHLATGNIDGDGDDELYIAFEQTISGTVFSSTYRYDGALVRINGPHTALRTTALTLGDRDGDGDDELFHAIRYDDGFSTVSESDSGLSLGTIIVSSDETTFHSLALVDIDNDNDDELFVAYERASETGIFRQGSSPFWTSPGGYWAVDVMTGGDVEGDGNTELFFGLSNQAGESRIYRTNTGYTIGNRLWDSLWWRVEAIEIGDFGAGPALFTGFNHSDGFSAIYRSNTGVPTGSRIYGFSSWWAL